MHNADGQSLIPGRGNFNCSLCSFDMQQESLILVTVNSIPVCHHRNCFRSEELARNKIEVYDLET